MLHHYRKSWAALGMLLLLIGVILLLGAAPIRSAAGQGTPPAVTFTPSAECAGLIVPRLLVGQAGRVLPGDPNNLRDQPSTSAVKLGEIPGGAQFVVLEGPTCAGGIVWWKVEYQNVKGWTGEGQSTTYWVEPVQLPAAMPTLPPQPTSNQPAAVLLTAAPTIEQTPLSTPPFTCPDALPPRLTIGGAGRVLPGDPNSLRSKPSTQGSKIGEIPGGSTFRVLEGPECADGIVWWSVDFNGVIGWTGESKGQDYWVEPDTSTVFPTATPTIIQCPNLPPTQLSIGSTGRVKAGNSSNLRSEASTSGTKLGAIPSGGVFSVLEGPICDGDLRWWRVDHNGLAGWTAEGQGEEYWVEPYTAPYAPTPPTPAAPCPGGAPPRLLPGGQGRVLPPESNNVREYANVDSEQAGQLPPESIFSVIEGPVCNDNMTWWKISGNGVWGWTAEMKGQEYWVEPYGNPPVARCPNNPPPRLTVGTPGRVLPPDSNILRREPTTLSQNIGSMPMRSLFNVIEGPLCSDGKTWWHVDFNGLLGWTVESESNYWLSPVGCPNRGIVAGGDAYVLDVAPMFRKLWPEPNEANNPEATEGFVGRVGGNINVKVLEGPVCTGTIDWWKVDNYNGLVGWIQGDVLSPPFSYD